MATEPNFFENDGHEKVFVTYPTVFMNSECMFIEYDDVIKTPYFTYLYALLTNEAANEIFDFSELEDLSLNELFQWYIDREERNVLRNLPVWNTIWECLFHSNQEEYDKWVDEFVFQNAINDNPEILNIDTSLNFVKVLHALAKAKMVTHLYFYTEYKIDAIEEDVKELFSDFTIHYVYGDLVTVLKENHIPNNSTFVFSDIDKIDALIEAERIGGSSILLSERFGYNYRPVEKSEEPTDTEEDELEEELRFKESWGNYVFKFDTFNNIYETSSSS